MGKTTIAQIAGLLVFALGCGRDPMTLPADASVKTGGKPGTGGGVSVGGGGGTRDTGGIISGGAPGGGGAAGGAYGGAGGAPANGGAGGVHITGGNGGTQAGGAGGIRSSGGAGGITFVIPDADIGSLLRDGGLNGILDAPRDSIVGQIICGPEVKLGASCSGTSQACVLPNLGGVCLCQNGTYLCPTNTTGTPAACPSSALSGGSCAAMMSTCIGDSYACLCVLSYVCVQL